MKRLDESDYFNMLERHVKNAILNFKLFDSGHFESADQLIGIIRALVHDTNVSISILKRLGDKERIYYHDTSIDYPPDAFHVQSLLFSAYSKFPALGDEFKQLILPKFYFEDEYEKTSAFEDWWENNIIKINNRSYSRKKIVIIKAHKEGVLHSDEKIDEIYYSLSQDIISFAYFTETEDIENHNTEVQTIENSINSLIRQIAHELILSLIYYYDLNVDYPPDLSEISVIQNDIYKLEFYVNSDVEKKCRDVIKERPSENM